MPEAFIAALCVLLAIVGICGVVVPVLPGSITVAAALLVWAIWGGGWAWLAFGIGIVLLAIGMLSGWFLAKRGLDSKEIPNWPVIVGAVAGVVGMFVIPAFGLPIGFVIGLVVSEYIRLNDWRLALDTSWTATKALGLGMLIEFTCASLTLLVICGSILAHFLLGL